MTDKPSDDEKPDHEAFERTLRNLVNTPHKPHKEKAEAPKGPRPSSAGRLPRE